MNEIDLHAARATDQHDRSASGEPPPGNGERRAPTGQQMLVAGLFFAATAALWRYLGALLHPNALTYSGAFWLEDIRPTYNAARAILAGNGAGMYDPAVVHGYTYTPLFAWLFTPFALLSWETAGAIWYALCHLWLWLAVAGVAMLLADVLPAQWLTPRLGRVPLVPLLAGIALTIAPWVQAELDFGQVDYLILALLCAAVICLRRDRDVLAGICVVLAAAFKFTPIGLVAVLLVARRPRALLGAAVTAIVAVVVTSLDPRVGLGTWLHLGQGVNANLEYIFGQYGNESLAGVAAHLLDLVHRHLNASLGEYLGLGLAALLFGAVLLVALLDGARTSARLVLACAVGLGALLIASPLNWDHSYAVACIPAAVALGAAATEWAATGRLRRWHLVAAFAVALLVNWPTTAALNVSAGAGLRDRIGGTLLVSARPVALLVLTAILLWLYATPVLARRRAVLSGSTTSTEGAETASK